MPGEITAMTNGNVADDVQNSVLNAVQNGTAKNLESTNINTRAMKNEQWCDF